MDIRQKVVFESKHGNHVFTFSIPSEASWGEALDASFAFMNEVKAQIARAVESNNSQLQGE